MRITAATRIHDVTLPISSAFPVWPGDPPIDVRAMTRTANGDEFNTSQIICPSHCGTHVDPPFHRIHDSPNLDEIPLERWIGPCQVIGFDDSIKRIEPSHLDSAGIGPGITRVLFKSRNSEHWSRVPLTFDTDYTALTGDAANWIVDRGIKLIGVDALSFEPYDATDSEIHRTLLGNDVVAIEGLDLSAVQPGMYDLICLPLKLAHGDGAPARVILLEHVDV